MTTPSDHAPQPEQRQLVPQNQVAYPPRPMMPPWNARHAAVAATDTGLSPAFLWRVFCQWWKWIIPASLILASVATTLVFVFHVPKYEAKALVKIESNTPFIAFNDDASRGGGDMYVQTQIELLRGPYVLGPVLARPEVAEIAEIKKQIDPVKYLEKTVSVGQIGKSELYEVSFTSRSPQDARKVANAIVSVYLDLQDKTEKSRAQIVIDVLDKEQAIREEKVGQLRKRVVEMAKELTGRDPFDPAIITDDNAFTIAPGLYQSLTEADVMLEVLNAELQSLQNAPIIAADKIAASGALDLEVAGHPDVQLIEKTIGEYKAVQEAIRAMPRARIGDSWENDPEYHRVEKLIKEARERLTDTKATVRKQLAQLRIERDKAEQERLHALKLGELAALKSKRDLLYEKYQEQLNELKTGGAKSAEFEFAKAELVREEKVLELIAARKLALQTEMRAPARVSLLEPAPAPTVAIEPIPYKYMLAAAALALAAPFGLAFAYEMALRRISDSDQLASETMLPILGEVARLPRRKVTASPTALMSEKPREYYIYAESIDSLRTQLLLTEGVGSSDAKKVIAVCSAASGEGKTTVATALAMSIAETTRQPTLIIDADLRDPDVNVYLGITSKPGLTEVLEGKAVVGEAIHRVQNTQLFVMPAGRQRMNPHHLLHNSRIDNLLDNVRESFSTIIVDTPPLLSASESLVYAKAADLVVYCSLADVSRVKQVRTAVQRLQATGATIAGAVLSGMPVHRYVYQYGSYHHPSRT